MFDETPSWSGIRLALEGPDSGLYEYVANLMVHISRFGMTIEYPISAGPRPFELLHIIGNAPSWMVAVARQNGETLNAALERQEITVLNTELPRLFETVDQVKRAGLFSEASPMYLACFRQNPCVRRSHQRVVGLLSGAS